MAPRTQSFGVQLKALREAAGFTQEELATISGLSVHAVSALERGQRRRPHLETVRALSAALDLTPPVRDAFLASARPAAQDSAIEEPIGVPLPLPLTVLLGREADVRTLGQWIADPTARLITLIGPGGVGKTRLALEVGRALADEGATRVRFASLSAIPDAAFVASAIAEALGLADVTPRDLPKRARACCDSPTMLLLDNFEHVVAAAPLVADLLSSIESLRLLVTSRAPLHIRGEREYAVGPLALSTDSEVPSPADLARLPAVRLFVERVRDVQPDFHLTAANASTVTAICRRLDALPLALELAAPRVKALTAEGLLLRLERDVLFSTRGPRDLPERQRTMNATVAWSYQLLGRDEQRAFRRFGALQGPFPICAAAAVLAGRTGASPGNDEALHAAAGLIDNSLLLRAETSVDPASPRYHMLETVRAYAALELTAAGELDDALEGLVRYCSVEASVAAEELVGHEQVHSLDRVREDLESYRAALAWLIERGRADEACDIAWALLFFWVIRGHTAEGLQWYEQILGLSPLPPVAESRALTGVALMRYTHGDLEHARAAGDRALTLAGEDREIVAKAALFLGHIEHARGNLTEACTWFTRSLEEFRGLAFPWGVGHTLSALAWVAVATGDTGRAERLLDESRSVLRPAAPWFLALGLYLRAVLAVRRRNPREAIALARENLARIRDCQDAFAFVYALVPLAAAAGLTSDDAWVARIVGARNAITERTGATFVDPSMQDLCEQTEREARSRLGPDRWAQAYAAGRRTSIDGLLKEIDTRSAETP